MSQNDVLIKQIVEEVLKNLLKIQEVGGLMISSNFAVIITPANKVDEIKKLVIRIVNIEEFSTILTLNDISPVEASGAPVFNTNPYLKLNGRGVLVGVIDTGIDYTHPAFRNSDGTTRIEYIYDLNNGGKVYNKTQINEALKLTDPYSMVNSTDVTGHGTHVVGIACAGGEIDKQYYGVAPESSIAMVKVSRSRFALSTQIMKGIKFLIDKGKELNMPLAINMSLSTNDGAHNGSSLLEQYISTVSAIERVTIVIAAGNEGEAAHHVGRTLEEINDVYFNISSDESIVVINLYKSILPELSMELLSPYGIGTGEIILKEGINEGTIGNSRYSIYLTGPKPFDVSGEIGIVLTGINEFVSSGQWKITLRKLNEYEGSFDMWLPISEGLNVNTKFLEPVVYNTLGIPATVKNIISVGSYNYLVDTMSPFSGRGKRVNGQYIKPDIVAPGEGIYSAIPNRGFDKKTGTAAICHSCITFALSILTISYDFPYFLNAFLCDCRNLLRLHSVFMHPGYHCCFCSRFTDCNSLFFDSFTQITHCTHIPSQIFFQLNIVLCFHDRHFLIYCQFLRQ